MNQGKYTLNQESYVALIPARGGSKGIPDKNIRNLNGKPLIAWTIEQSLSCSQISSTVVSTDSKRIAAVAREYGAEVPFMRPAELATDESATEDALIHAVKELTGNGNRIDNIVVLQPTSPIRKKQTLDQAIKAYSSSNYDSLLSVVKRPPFYWKSSPEVQPLYDIFARPRRQDIPVDQFLYKETGSIYISSVSLLEQQRNRLGGNICLFETSEIEAVDIDTEFDFELVEWLMHRQESL